MKLPIFILCTVLLFSCQSEIDKYGGISITIINENKNLSAEELEQDFNTLRSRLDEVVDGSFEIRHLQDKNTIKVTIPKEKDLDFFQWLLTTKGHFQLKETYNSDDVWKNIEDVKYVLSDSSRFGIDMYNDGVKRNLFNALTIPSLSDMRPSIEMGVANKLHVDAISKVLGHPDVMEAFPNGLEPMWMMFSDTANRLMATKKVRHEVRFENESVDKCNVSEFPEGMFRTVISLKPQHHAALKDFTEVNLHGWTVTTIDKNVYGIPVFDEIEREGILTLGIFKSERDALALAAIVSNPMLNADWDIAQSQMMGPQH